jgi:hypothetical protein
MRFTASAAIAAILCLGAASITVSSVSLAAAPLPSSTQALLPETAPGANAVAPRLDATVALGDATLSTGTQLPQPGTVPAITPEVPAASLAALVDRNDDDVAGLDSEMRCLASAVFYEARSESLQGKLAVARVIINRSESGRFPSSLCGVVTQPGQFSFVRSGHIPAAPTSTHQWSDSVAVARIASTDGWDSAAEGALYFHARRVAPGWGRPRVAQIDNHIFYR